MTVHSTTLASVAGRNTPVSRPATVLEPLAPLDERDAILELFRTNGKREFAETFDWHYGAGSSRSESWCLRRRIDGRLVGFTSVFERRVRVGDLTLRAGVPGNLIVAEEARSLGAAVSLIRATQAPVRDGRLDFLVTRGNHDAHRLAERLGYKPIGVWQQSHLLLHGPRGRTRERLGRIGALAAGAGSAWARFRLGRHEAPSGYGVEHFPRDEMDRIEVDTTSWTASEQITVEYPRQELAWRYFGDPRKPTTLAVIRSPENEAVAYFAIVEPEDGGLFIRDFRTDHRHLADIEALRILIEWASGRPRISFRVFRGTRLASELSFLGCLHARAAGRPVLAYWQKTHPLATRFASTSSWRLLPGYSDV